MDEETLINNLTSCKPLATRLVTQGYEYSFDPDDLQFLAYLGPAYESFFASPENKDLSLVTNSGLSQQEFRWLIVFYEMREDLQKHALAPASPAYKPFQERLDFLTASKEVDLLNTRNGVPDPEHLILVALARSDPFYLAIAEKRLTINLTHQPDQPITTSFTPREKQTLQEFRNRMQQEDLFRLLPADFFHRK